MVTMKTVASLCPSLFLLIILSLATACSENKEPWDLHTEQGLTFRDQGKFPEAEQELKEALALAEKTEAKPTQVPQSLTNLAILSNAKGDPKGAESYLQKTIAIQEQGTTSPELAATLSNLGALYVSQQEYEKALQAFERGIVIREQAFGKDDPEVIRDLENIAGLFVRQSKYAEAEPYLQRALDTT